MCYFGKVPNFKAFIFYVAQLDGVCVVKTNRPVHCDKGKTQQRIVDKGEPDERSQ